ncbi:MAG: translation initiation factor IF-2 [Phycisphaerales bacterium]|nr:translation initiation factor IF-2 [Phycisphaerales bacterium]
MADKLRVHILSKELGVTSKAIVAKCQSEEVEGITNHMSTVSAGLAETIREWFSNGEHQTAVEEAAPVDLEKVKVRRRPSRKKKTETESQPEKTTAQEPISEEAGTAVDEPAQSEAVPVIDEEPPAPPESTVAVAEVPPPEIVPEEQVPPLETVAETAGSVLTESPEIITAPSAPEEAPDIAPLDQEQEQQLAPAAEAPKKPEPIKPAGPQNVPAPAQMKGPRIVGFAKPDPIRPPSPRPRERAPSLLEQVEDQDSAGGGRKGVKGKGSAKDAAARKTRHRANPRRSVTSLNEVGERLREWNDRDLLERQERLLAASGRGIHARRALDKAAAEHPHIIAPRKTKAQVKEPIILHQLCAATGIGMMQMMPRLKKELDMMINRNTVIPAELAPLIMLDFGVELEVVKPKSKLEELREAFAQRPLNNLQPRPPVVTMLGHVDHGKTSLLDAIRKTHVAEGETGGITQHIGAYRVQREGLSVTFLDTPGHEAFTAMRARGANVTDVVVLVVAADDGLMPQTIEAINHARAANVTIVVALNKIDLPGVDLNKIYGQLSEMSLAPTEWGGDTDVVKTSATKGQGVDELIAHLGMLTELLDLKADPTVPATGAVLEAQIRTGMGPLARMLVKEGTLRTGDCLVCGPAAGRIRTMRDDHGRVIKEATPGMPVEVAGLDEVPGAGDSFFVVDTLQQAKEIAEETRQIQRRESLNQMRKPQTLEELLRRRESGTIPELNLIMRADMQGSTDALLKALKDIPTEEVKLNFLHTGVGTITESDVVLAQASGALIVGFNVTADPAAQKMAETEGVDIRLYRIIYNLLDDIRLALEGLLPKDKNEEVRGKAEVRETFNLSRMGVVAGCMVIDGIINRGHNVRVLRDGKIILPTADDVKHGRHRSMSSLRRFKEDAREVRAGMECGLRVEDFTDIKPGDLIEAYEVIEVARKL